MEEREMTRRKEYALSLLRRLEESNDSLRLLADEAQSDGGSALAEARREGEEKIRAKRELHRRRVEELKESLAVITGVTNDWNAFRNDPEAQRRWSYPFLLTRRGREANQRLKAERERIQSLVLQNRLLEEEIRRMSDSVERDAISRAKESSGHAEWSAAVQQRQKLLDDLRLLLAAIPETARCTLDPGQTAPVAAMLSGTQPSPKA